MRILHVRLDGFGQFNQGLSVSFSPEGLTVLVGRNEAGKSTVLSAIVGVMFGFRDLNLVRKFEPWDTYDRFAGEVEVETDDGRRLIIGRDFKTQQATIEQLAQDQKSTLFEGRADPRGTSSDDHEYFELLGGILGFQDEVVFRNTVFFGQQSLQTQVSEQIRRLLSGSANVDYKGALHELHSRYAELTTRNPWTARDKGRKRLIEETRAQLDQERDRWTEGREALVRSLELEGELESLQENLTRLEQEVALASSETEAHEELFQLLGRKESARRHYEEALARRDNLKRYADRTAAIDELITRTFSQFRSAPADFSDLLRIVATEQQEIAQAEVQLKTEEQSLTDLKPEPNGSLGWFLGFLVLGIATALGAMTSLGTPAGAILGIVAGAIACAIGRNLGTGYAEARAALEERVESLKQSMTQRNRRIQDIRDRTGALLVGQTVEQVSDQFARYLELREEKKRLGAALKALGGQQEVNRSFEEAAREEGAIEAGLERIFQDHPQLTGKVSCSELGGILEELRGRLAKLQQKAQQDRTELEQHRLELAGLTARMDFDLALLAEGIQEKESTLERYDLEREALKETIDTLDGCVQDFQEGDVFRLGEEISRIFSRITEDRYSHIHLGSSMDPVISRGDRTPIAPCDLSQGTQDQLYFAMRVAMARHLSRDIRLPIFLDDPFVNFDHERLQITREVIRHLGDHQIVLVTCDRSYQDWADRVIDLDALPEAKTAVN